MLDSVEGARFAVFGGAGFVGSNIAHRLVDLGASCIVVDNLFTGARSNVPEAATFIIDSVTSEDVLDDVLGRVDYVINCAAVNIMAAQTSPFIDLDVNARGQLLLLEVAKRHKNLRRIVYTSTASVYGNSMHLPVSEDEAVRPMSNYAVSKLAGENYTTIGYLLGNLPTSIVRYSNVYGPRQSPANPYCGVIGKFFASVMRYGIAHLLGSGQQTRDFTYVDDAVEATLLAAVNPKAEGAIFNVATGVEITVRDLAVKIFGVVGCPPSFVHVDRRDIDNISRRCLSIENIRARLRWEPRVDIDEGLRRTHAWMSTATAADVAPQP